MNKSINEKDFFLEVNGLNAWFDSYQALKNINLSIGEGEVLALIGPSGCGKSTFVRCINRLHEEIVGARVSGEVRISGKNIYSKKNDPVKIRRQVGMAFQKPNPFPGLSIYENVCIGLKLSGVRKKALLDEAVERSLKEAALWDEVKDKLNQSGYALSGGQQQRLCIARALAMKPSILLMDEPTSALDPASTVKIEELIGELKKHMTILIVTHNMQQAARVSDKTAFFESGKLVEFGKTTHIFTKPKNKRTEDYITGRFS